MIVLEAGDTLMGIAGSGSSVYVAGSILEVDTTTGAEVFVNFGPTATSNVPATTTYYTCPAGKAALVKSLSVVNTNAASRTIRIGLNGTGTTSGLYDITLAGNYQASYDGEWRVYDANGVVQVATSAGGGVSDGDKGDITVSASGATWTIDAGVVTLAKLADLATQRLIARNTAGTGVPEAVTIQQLLNWLMTANGDIITRSGGTPIRLATGSAHQRLSTDGTDLVWKGARYCYAKRTGQTLGSGTTLTPLQFTSADTTDTDAFHDPSTNSGQRFVVPTGMGGLYLFVIGADHSGDTNTTGIRKIAIGKNLAGTATDATVELGTFIASAANIGAGNLSTTWMGTLAAGDYLEGFYAQNSGSNRSMNMTASFAFLGP